MKQVKGSTGEDFAAYILPVKKGRSETLELRVIDSPAKRDEVKRRLSSKFADAVVEDRPHEGRMIALYVKDLDIDATAEEFTAAIKNVVYDISSRKEVVSSLFEATRVRHNTKRDGPIPGTRCQDSRR